MLRTVTAPSTAETFSSLDRLLSQNRRTPREEGEKRYYADHIAPLGVAMENIMQAYAVRTTATWFAAIFVSSLFVTAATSTIGLL